MSQQVEAKPVVSRTITVAATQERAFQVFTEQIGSWWPKDYHIGEADMADFVLVEILFIGEGDGRTRVELEHRHLERHLQDADAVHGAVDGAGGWGFCLAAYADGVRKLSAAS